MTDLRQRMIDDLRIRNYSPRTVACYVRCVAAFARHFGRSPATLGPEQIRAYQTYLIERKGASWSGFNQAVCALRFLYGTTLQRPGTVQDIPFPRQPKRLPVVLSRPELGRFFAALPNLKHRTVLMTMYAAGLRVLEALHLRVADVDRGRQCLRVVQGKGQKDRYTLLPPTLLAQLRTYWQATHPASAWLFPGRLATRPLTPTAVQRQTGARQHALHGLRRTADGPRRGRMRLARAHPPHQLLPIERRQPIGRPTSVPHRDLQV